MNPKQVLIVEDDEAMSVALRDGFAYEGYAVEMARDGEEGLRLAAAKPPDLMILEDRKSTRLNSSHSQISYAVFCLKKKTKRHTHFGAHRAGHDSVRPPDR